MKSIYQFCTKPWVYLTELPVLAIFWLAMHFNDRSTHPLKFYPLIFVSGAFIIFIMVYFFRYVSINNDEIRQHGLFSSKDSALISENKTLVVILRPRFNAKLELYADAGEEPAFDWMKATDVLHRDICIFRSRIFGGKATAKKILKYFTLSSEEASAITKVDGTYENDAVKVTSVTENENFKISIKFKITII